jgi:hypothetical protein
MKDGNWNILRAGDGEGNIVGFLEGTVTQLLLKRLGIQEL